MQRAPPSLAAGGTSGAFQSERARRCRSHLFGVGRPDAAPPPFGPLFRPPLRFVSLGVPSGTPLRGGSGTSELEAPKPALRRRAAVGAKCGRPRRRGGGGGGGGGGGDAGARWRVRGRRSSWHVRC